MVAQRQPRSSLILDHLRALAHRRQDYRGLDGLGRVLASPKRRSHLDIAVRIGHDCLMTTDKHTVAFIVEQLSTAGDVSAKPMFGEYGLYCDGKMFGMICDGQLFIKPTAGGRTLGSELEEAPPYPGAKPCLLVDPDRWDDSDWLTELVRITTTELPAPKPKARKANRREA